MPKSIIGNLLCVLLFSCISEKMIDVDEFENHKKIIYGRISYKITFSESEVNNFLLKNDIIKINCRDCIYKIERIRIDHKRNVIKLQQYYKGYKVFGHTIVLHTDGEFHPIYIIDHSFPLEGNILIPERIISLDEAKRVLYNYFNSDNLQYKPFELGIVTYTEKPLLRYRVKAFAPGRPFDGGTFDIDAVSGEIVRYEPAIVSTRVSIVNTNNELVDVEIAKNPEEYSGNDCADNYCTVDTTRGTTEVFGSKYIKTFYELEQVQLPGEIPTSAMLFSSPQPDIWEGIMPDGAMTRRIEGISAHYSAQKIFDWYAKLGLTGIVNKNNGFRVYIEKMAHSPLDLNAFWDIYSHSAMVLWAYQPDENLSRSFASSYDVVGHEYTHGVLSAPLSEGGLAELEYHNSNFPKNESASVQEGLCDTMGSLSQGDENPNWLLGYNGLIDDTGNRRWIRNNSNPSDANALTWGDKEYIGQCDKRLCAKYPPPDGHKDACGAPFDMYDSWYICATTISHPAWKIKNGIGVDKTSKIYFNVIDKYLQKKELIPSVSQYVFDSCMELYNNNEGECCVVYRALTESKFNINLRGLACPPISDAGLTDAIVDTLDYIGEKDAGNDVFYTEDSEYFDNANDASIDTVDIESHDTALDVPSFDVLDEEVEDIEKAEDIIDDKGIDDGIEKTKDVSENINVDQISDGNITQSDESSSGCSCSFID
ncbi:MAG: M4 family metallopeptidase [Deltaproteobacteria bacterium]|nr:M4 family metallopeptidase [Deltaproteobacteria bacterium]